MIIENDDKVDAVLQEFSEQEHSSQYTPFSYTPQLQTPVTPVLATEEHRRITCRHLPSPSKIDRNNKQIGTRLAMKLSNGRSSKRTTCFKLLRRAKYLIIQNLKTVNLQIKPRGL